MPGKAIYKNEDLEQYNLVQWLEINNYKFTSIPNSTRTRSWNQKRRNTDLWVRPWMSDLIIILKRWNMLFLELKKAPWARWWANGSVISKYQLEWQEAINKCSWVQYEIVQWCERAKWLIINLENNGNTNEPKS